MNESAYHELMDAAARGQPEQQAGMEAYLQAHPEARQDWQDQLRLTRLLRQLPDAPLASNFTARVLATVERSEARHRRSANADKWRWLRSFAYGWPAALAAAALGLGLLGHYQYHLRARTELARSVATVSKLESWPTTEMLQDFEPISILPTTSWGEDYKLLNLLAAQN